MSVPPPSHLTGASTELIARPGPRADHLKDPTLIYAGVWRVNPASNRVGVRLDRTETSSEAALAHRDLPELRSEGIPLGGIQVPPSGQPVVFLADHPVTGGYPVVAVLVGDSLHRAAQLRAGDVIRFVDG